MWAGVVVFALLFGAMVFGLSLSVVAE